MLYTPSFSREYVEEIAGGGTRDEASNEIRPQSLKADYHLIRLECDILFETIED